MLRACQRVEVAAEVAEAETVRPLPDGGAEGAIRKPLARALRRTRRRARGMPGHV